VGVDGLPAVLSAAEPPSGLSPEGPAAESIAWLWWLMFGLGLAVFVAVLVVFVVALRRRREQPLEEDAVAGEGGPGGANWLVLIGGVAAPAVVGVVLMVLMITVGSDVRALEALLDDPGEPLVVEVTGYKWWWDVEYPEAGVRTANEIRIPAGRPIEFRVTSADVIHSFWVPELGGKIDMNPGEVNTLRVQADEPGVHRGLCTEYCGLQHAKMHLLVHVLPSEEFDDWLAERQEPPPEPETAAAREGLEIFEGAQCVRCHTVDGVSPYTERGPDLTDFATRDTLAAGVEDNDPETLAQWIVDPHTLKEGVAMPASSFDDEELDALIEYLETLE
jgi:cytochrome c oxidase subunit 2